MKQEEYGRMFALEERLWWYRGMRLIAETLLQEALERRPTVGSSGGRRQILDAGGGTGGNAVWLGAYGEVTLLDSSWQALEYCRERRLPRVCRGSVSALPFPDGTFDLVTS